MPICEHRRSIFFFRTKTRDKIATMYDPQIIYDSKKDTLSLTFLMEMRESEDNLNLSDMGPWSWQT